MGINAEGRGNATKSELSGAPDTIATFGEKAYHLFGFFLPFHPIMFLFPIPISLLFFHQCIISISREE